MYGIYIHIPFCVNKCPYCDFNSYANKGYLAEEYVSALLIEAKKYKDKKVDTIFIGGGTPTCLPKDLLPKLLERIFNIFKITDDAEITVEANPGTLTPQLLTSLKHTGVNRLSIGAQSLNPQTLKRIGRIHTKEDFYKAVEMAKNAGFTNISADMMFALPNQTLTDWEKDILEISKMDLTHISCYSLKIEEGTPFYEQGVQLASDELDRSMYHLAVEILQNEGYERYEISNFAKKGYESRHNLKYWLCEEYIGLGAGASSFIDNARFSNIKSVEDYILKIKNNDSIEEEKTELTQNEIISERIFLGLRLDRGIPIELLQKYENHDKITKRLMDNGLIEKDNKIIKLTKKGIDLSNQVFMEFI